MCARSLSLILCGAVGVLGELVRLRPPCTPLNVVSPYQSTWSCSDNLFDSYPQHWTGSTIGMYGILIVDDAVFRYMGPSDGKYTAQPVTQTGLTVAPTTTTYSFEAGGVSLKLSFVTPAIDLDTDILMASRPITHVTYELSSLDGKEHRVQLYYDNTAEGAVSKLDQPVEWSRPTPSKDGLTVMQVGTSAQKYLAQGSDRIDWGYWFVSTPSSAGGLHTAMVGATTSRQAFVNGSYFQLPDSTPGKAPVDASWPSLSVAWQVALSPSSTDVEQRHLTLAYDQVLSMRFFGTDMAPLWRRNWSNAVDMLEAVEAAREEDLRRTSAFDSKLIEDLSARGGAKYATLASLVYRQVTGGTQEVYNHVVGDAWVFMKEISSDGDVSTVDVVYPAFPMFQYLYPEYFRRTLLPLLVYGNQETKIYGLDIKYNLAWAPHHLGHWPISDLAPERQEQMPLEESGNMLIMLAALHGDTSFPSYLRPYLPMLDRWADYIVKSLPDPGNQLCTDDFEGPSPHNTNLAAKGIVALEAYATLIALADADHAAKAKSLVQLAAGFAQNWTAVAADGDHYRIQFNLNGTWSQKYNLLYQKALQLKSFPQSVFDTESVYYQKQMKKCGVPLDDRHPYTKSDWSLWTASIASTQEQFLAIVDGVFNFANTTSSRIPLSDWYDVETCEAKGFRARPVQGGLFAKMIVPPFEEPQENTILT